MKIYQKVGYNLNISEKVLVHDVPGVFQPSVRYHPLELDDVCRTEEEAILAVKIFFEELRKRDGMDDETSD